MERNKIHYKCKKKKKKNSKKQIKSIKINGKEETSSRILTDPFNNFFVSIAENIDKKLSIQMQITRTTWKIQ